MQAKYYSLKIVWGGYMTRRLYMQVYLQGLLPLVWNFHQTHISRFRDIHVQLKFAFQVILGLLQFSAMLQMWLGDVIRWDVFPKYSFLHLLRFVSVSCSQHGLLYSWSELDSSVMSRVKDNVDFNYGISIGVWDTPTQTTFQFFIALIGQSTNW